MRVVVCTLGAEPGPVGGAERQAWRQATILAARGHQVTLVCPWTPGTRSGRRDGVVVRRLPQLPVRFVRTLSYAPFLFLYLIACARSATICHVHLANLHADAAAAACRLVRLPMYLKIAAGGPRGDVRRLAWMAPVTRRVAYRWSARIQAISDEIETDLLEINVPSDKIVRIPNGLDTERFRPPVPAQRLASRRRLGLPEEARVVLFLGRFAGYKGIGDLLAAWPSVHGDAVLLLIGEPALDDPVEVPAATPTIRVLPWAPDVIDALHAADILVQPSHAEGMSNTILEAMATGLSIIATDVGAAREMLGEDAGVIVSPRDPAALSAALDDLLENDGRRVDLARRAREVAVQRYGIARVVARIEAEYAAVAGERHG